MFGIVNDIPLWLWVLVVASTLVTAAFLTGAVRYIPHNRVGVVEKLVSARGSLKSGLLALAGEAGYQPGLLRGGWHLFVPFQYRVHRLPLVTIPQGKIGYVFARDGRPLAPMQTLASNPAPTDFQDAAAFLSGGGQKGPQRQVLREGTYAINLVLFVVVTESGVHYLPLDRSDDEIFKRMASLIAERQGFTPVVIKGADDLVGVVTTHDGPALSGGEIIAPTVGDDRARPETYHNNFQDPEKFLRAGGFRGRQLQVLVEGTYFVNRLFATVEVIPKTVVDVGHVGVVVSYTGAAGADLSGVEYKHGELVAEGRRGVWSTPLLPGKYAFNTYAGKVVIVPTTNFILKWIKSETGAHRFDENLAEVSLITKDAFEPSLPLSVVLHIDYRKAPLVVQRFGDIKRLVEQTLDPMVSAYFKNVGQTRTLIQLLQERAGIQRIASEEMREKFAHYNLELEEVLIGTPSAGTHGDGLIDRILTQLRERQIAEEKIQTYLQQEKAAVKERELREAEARAKQQTTLTESEVAIVIHTNQGRAEAQRAQQEAARIQTLAEAEGRKVRILADAEAGRVKAIGEADADRAARVGVAQALAAEEQVRAYGGPQYQITQQVMSRLAEAIEKSGIDLVPKIVMGADGGGTGGSRTNAFEALLAMLLSEKVGALATDKTPRDPQLEAAASALRKDLLGKISGPRAA